MARNRRLNAVTFVALFLVANLTVSLLLNLAFVVVKFPGEQQDPDHQRHDEQDEFHLSTINQLQNDNHLGQTRRDKQQQGRRPALVPKDIRNNIPSTTKQSLTGSLDCRAHGGPEDASEMVYWRDIPADATFQSPFYSEDQGEKFLLWDIDPAGFNNKRISLENFVLLAHITGRTLVLPPRAIWWGFSSDKNGTLLTDNKIKPRWSFEDFFDLQQIARKQKGFKVMSMEDFLKQHALTGRLRPNNGRSLPLFPPYNQTDWNRGFHKPLKTYLAQVTTHITWRPETCIAAVGDDVAMMNQTLRRILQRGGPPPTSHWIGKPLSVDASVQDRMEQIMTDRRNLCTYDQRLQQAPYLYYHMIYDATNYRLTFVDNIRLLIYFYCFFFFQDWHYDLWSKRFLRDYLRYRDEIQCAAARVVDALRRMSQEFDTLHIRRLGEFEKQYGNLTTAEELLQSVQPEISNGTLIYIATDEMNATYFDPLRRHYRLAFLKDFIHLLPGLDVNYYSLIDQLVASRGRKFFGAFCSTFTGYITRLRGYHASLQNLPGHETGALSTSWFYNYNKEGKRDKLQSYHPPVNTWFFREYPLAWRDIDRDVKSFNSKAEE